MQVHLSPAAMQALANIRKSTFKLPELAEFREETPMVSTAPPASEPPSTDFNERTFARNNLNVKVPLFMDGLRRAFHEIGLEIANADGFVEVPEQGMVKWQEVCDRTVTFLKCHFQGGVV